MRTKITLKFCGYLFIIGISSLIASAMPVSPNTTELRTGWELASSWNVNQDGRVISSISYDAADRWYEIKQMPATVLEILLQEDGSVYLQICILART